MLRPRSLTPEEARAYLDDIRPRFLLLRVRADRAHFVWGVPLWALEEIVAFALGAVAFLSLLRPVLPAGWLSRLGDLPVLASSAPAPEEARPTLGELLRLADELAGGSLQNVLRIPPGESYLLVNAGDTRVELTAH